MKRFPEAFERSEAVFLLILSLVLALRNLGLILVLPVLALFAADLEGATPTRVGLTIGIYGLTQALFQLPFGRLSDRIGRRRAAVAGLIVFAAGNFVAGLSGHILLLIAGRALMGMGAIASVCFAWISDCIPAERRSRSFGVTTAAMSLAAFLGLLAGPVLYRLFPLAYTFDGCAVFGLLAAAVVGVQLRGADVSRDGASTAGAPRGPGLRKLSRDPYVLRHGLMGLVTNFFMTSLFFAVPFELKAFMPPQEIWKVITPVMGTGLLFLVAATRLADRGYLRGVIQGGFALEGLAALVLLVTPSFPSLVLCLFLFVGGYTVLAPTVPSSLSRRYGPMQFGAVMGLYSMFLFFGSFLGATLSGMLYACGFVWIGALLTGISLLGGWLNLGLWRAVEPTAADARGGPPGIPDA